VHCVDLYFITYRP